MILLSSSWILNIYADFGSITKIEISILDQFIHALYVHDSYAVVHIDNTGRVQSIVCIYVPLDFNMTGIC